MRTLYDRLREYGSSDHYGFHMPGHKRKLNMLGEELPFAIDITEIDGFDDLHHAGGILKDAQERAARVYHAGETHFLLNGSSVGILSAVAGVTRRGDTVLVARNCHKSVYHAIEMFGLNPVYLMPGFDLSLQLNTEVSAEDVRTALKKEPGIRAVVIVSPTYDGVVSDVEAIAEAVHEVGIPLIVDGAHGAHFGFHAYFPEHSNVQGADLVINSLHKTLPSLTQTALLHMNGSLVCRERVRRYLHMLQSSSPSYLLMASIDSCTDLLEHRRAELFGPYVERLIRLRAELACLEKLQLIETERYDRSKVMISVRNADISSRELCQILLKDHHLQMEMAAGTYILAMTSVGDTQEGMRRLAAALKEIDERCSLRARGEAEGMHSPLPSCPEVVYNSSDAEMLSELEGTGKRRLTKKAVQFRDSTGCIAAEYAYLYPPGIPLAVPGEKITKEAASMLQWYDREGFSIEGLKNAQYIEVWMYE